MKFRARYLVGGVLKVIFYEPPDDPDAARLALAGLFRVPLDRVDAYGEAHPDTFYVLIADVREPDEVES